jgi:cytochrome c-type biogenesis protein CcmH
MYAGSAPPIGGRSGYYGLVTLWLVFALMTAAAVFAVLWPLARRRDIQSGSELEVYRDQLDEIERDRAAGLIGEAEAQAARVEVSRRLIAAADAVEFSRPTGSPLWRRRVVAAAALTVVPVGAIALYFALGSPQMPGEPLQVRLRALHDDRSIASLVAQVEAHLAQNPNDARGYAVLAPVYLELGRLDDAVNARHRVLALAGETADRQADLGEVLTAAAKGVVTAEAKKTFERAVTLNASEPKARFYLGVAAMQDGDRAKAASIWQDMLKSAPSDAPWAGVVQKALAQIGVSPPAIAAVPPPADVPGPNAGDIAAASQMREQDRTTMVRGMVERLADRLKQNADDVEGWQRLLRAYVVLNERDKAQAAAGEALRAFASDPGKRRQIEDTIKTLGLQS